MINQILCFVQSFHVVLSAFTFEDSNAFYQQNNMYNGSECKWFHLQAKLLHPLKYNFKDFENSMHK